MLPKYEPRTAISWKRADKTTFYGVVVSNVNGVVGIVPVLPSDPGIKYYDEGGSKYEKHRDNVKMRGCPPPLLDACSESYKHECYALAVSSKVFYKHAKDLIAAGVKEDFSDVPILFPTYVDILDHCWRDEKQYGKKIIYDFQKHIPDGLRFVDVQSDRAHAVSIGGIFYQSDETGIYSPSPISREQRIQWQTDRPPRYTVTGFGSEDVRAYKLVEPDQTIDYLRQIVQNGSMVTRAYPSDFDPEYGPNMRRFVQAPENIALLVPLGQRGNVIVQNINAGDQIDTTNPLCVFGMPQEALAEQYTVYDRYAGAQAGHGGPALTLEQALLRKARDLDEVRWRDSAYIPALSDETDAVVLARELEKGNPYLDQLSDQIAEKALNEQKDAARALMGAVSAQEFQPEGSQLETAVRSSKMQELLANPIFREERSGDKDRSDEYDGYV